MPPPSPLPKQQQLTIEKTWKQLLNQRQHVIKAKAKYEEDAIQINALHAQAALLQGRELDKVRPPVSLFSLISQRRLTGYKLSSVGAQASLKLDKVQQTVAVNERDYRNYVGVLKETTVFVPLFSLVTPSY